MNATDRKNTRAAIVEINDMRDRIAALEAQNRELMEALSHMTMNYILAWSEAKRVDVMEIEKHNIHVLAAKKLLAKYQEPKP